MYSFYVADETVYNSPFCEVDILPLAVILQSFAGVSGHKTDTPTTGNPGYLTLHSYRESFRPSVFSWGVGPFYGKFWSSNRLILRGLAILKAVAVFLQLKVLYRGVLPYGFSESGYLKT